MMKRLIAECAAIVFLAAAAGIGVNLFHPDGFVFVKKKETQSKIVRIDTRETLIKHSSGKAVFADARETGHFARGHIEGAVSVPAFPDAVRSEMIRRSFDRINAPAELVVYCGSGSCSAAETVARAIAQLGYSRHIYLYEDGFDEWTAKGLPTGAGE